MKRVIAMAMKAVRITVCWIGFLMVLSSMLMLASPILSLSTVDYGRPIKYEWVQKEEGKKLSLSYEITLEKTIADLQDAVKFPVRLGWVELLVLGALLFFAHVILIGSFYPTKEIGEAVFAVDFPAWMIVAVVIVASPSVGYWYFGTGDVLRSTVPDRELAEAILENFWFGGFVRMIVPFILFSILSVLMHEYSVRVFGALRSAAVSSCVLFRGRILREQECEIFGSDSGRKLIQMLDDDFVDVFGMDCSVKWTPLPAFALRKRDSVRLSLDRLFHFFTAGSKAAAFGELREKLVQLWGERFRDVGGDATASFRGEVMKLTSAEFKKRLAEAKAERLDHARERVEDFVCRVVDVSLRRFRNELLQIETSEFGALLQDLKECLRREIFSRLDRFMSGGRRGLLENNEGLLPQGTRFCFREGRNMVIVIEQAPQVRSIRADQYLSGNRNRDCYALAFPYTVFVVSMENGDFSRLRVFYRNSPIVSLEDELFRANVPNVDSDSQVCLRFPGCTGQGIFARASEVVGYFWESRFNTDLSDWYEIYQKRNDALSSLARWEVESKKDPSFVLGVQWVSSRTTLRDVIARQMADSEGEGMEGVVSGILEKAFSQGMDELRGALMKKMSALRVERRHSRVVTEVLDQCERDSIETLSRLTEDSFDAMCVDENISAVFEQVVSDVFRSILERDFAQLSEEVLLRRRVGSRELRRQLNVRS